MGKPPLRTSDLGDYDYRPAREVADADENTKVRSVIDVDIRGSINDYSAEHPHTAELVIEICVSSHDYDRSKLRAYAVAGVKECWLVLGPEKQIEVHRQPQGEQFAERALHGPGGSLNSTAVPSFTVEMDSLFTA